MNKDDLRLIVYALEHYSVGTDWHPIHKTQIVAVLSKMKAIQAGVPWEGEKPCSECGSKVHSKWEEGAQAWVCAGCYNELAYENGWERYPSREREELQENTPDYRGLGSID